MHHMLKSRIEFGKDVIITALPLYHIFAFTVNLMIFYYSGGHNVLIPNPRPLSNMKKAFDLFSFTWITGVNTLFNGLLHEPWFVENPPKTFKAAAAGGTALHNAVAKKWVEIVKSPIIEGYGLTESSPVLSFNPLEGVSKEDSIGLPIVDTEMKLVDDNGVEVGVGQSGEIIARGPQIMKGYWQRTKETSDVIKNGWLYTGDVGVKDADGYYKIVDRKKDMILVSGFNVYPNELEYCIAKHPKVTEVAVIGVPDEKSGEAVKAFIVKKKDDLTADEIKAHCHETLTGYKIPKYIEFRKELPKSPVGKILRKDLRAEELAKSR
jgi:long-chain acyl-CoA synthetase